MEYTAGTLDADVATNFKKKKKKKKNSTPTSTSAFDLKIIIYQF